MSDPFIEKLNEKNLCTWYVLPLLGLNADMFGTSNFRNSYLVKDQNLIVVEVVDARLSLLAAHSLYYQSAIFAEAADYLVFDIPDKWDWDMRMFKAGKYTKMSDEAKQTIKMLSGLNYEIEGEDEQRFTDSILMALDNRNELRTKWMEILATQERHLPDELLSPPADASFINLQSIM